MNPTIKLSNNSDKIHIFIPINLQRKGGRKTILNPLGVPVNSDRDAEQDLALLTSLVRAHRWSQMLQEGKFANQKELAEKEQLVGHSYVSRILRLTLLAPDIQEAILMGTHPANLSLADVMGPFPHAWEVQRKQFGFAA